MTKEEIRERIKYLDENISMIENNIHTQQRAVHLLEKQRAEVWKECAHEFKYRRYSKSKRSDIYDAVCEVCGFKSRGWFCLDSPDRSCHYKTYNRNGKRYVLDLYDGKEVEVPGYREDGEYDECDDWCVFCGQPEERK